MTFTFFAELDGEPTIVDGFLCALDGEVEDCSIGSITYEDLPLGTHTFQVVAFTDDPLIADPTPATFTWTIVEEPEEPEEPEDT